jgi:hypothetical protein
LRPGDPRAGNAPRPPRNFAALVTREPRRHIVRMILALFLLLVSAAWRIAALHVPALFNFAPLMALTFCGAVYFRDKRMWFVPFGALILSDIYLNHYHATVYNEGWTWGGMVVRAACFAVALPLGAWVSRHKGWLTLLGGALAGSVLFYLVTNTEAWLRDPAYAKTVAGWWQAITVGRPEFPSTLWFFRNTLASDLLFTGAFAVAMESAAVRAGRGSLFAKPTEA